MALLPRGLLMFLVIAVSVVQLKFIQWPCYFKPAEFSEKLLTVETVVERSRLENKSSAETTSWGLRNEHWPNSSCSEYKTVCKKRSIATGLIWILWLMSHRHRETWWKAHGRWDVCVLVCPNLENSWPFLLSLKHAVFSHRLRRHPMGPTAIALTYSL